MKDSQLISEYKKIVPFLAAICGPSCEIVLHDLTDVNYSVISIENGFHSGRNIGSPITDLAQQIIDDGSYIDHDFIANYSSTSKGKNYISSTYFIKNGDKLVGLLCFNRDISSITSLENSLELLKSQYNLRPTNTVIHEDLENPASSILKSLISDTIINTGLSSMHMSKDDKISIVHTLQSRGITKMKGAVSEIATQLNVSEPTVYRYMSKTHS